MDQLLGLLLLHLRSLEVAKFLQRLTSGPLSTPLKQSTPPSAFVPVEKPPTILFRHSGGPIAQTNDGRLLVYPGTVLHMECLWMRRFGNPKWNVTHFEPGLVTSQPVHCRIQGWRQDCQF